MECRVDPTFKELVGQCERVVGLIPITRDDPLRPYVFRHEFAGSCLRQVEIFGR